MGYYVSSSICFALSLKDSLIGKQISCGCYLVQWDQSWTLNMGIF